MACTDIVLSDRPYWASQTITSAAKEIISKYDPRVDPFGLPMAAAMRVVRAEGASRDLGTDYIIAAMGIDPGGHPAAREIDRLARIDQSP